MKVRIVPLLMGLAVGLVSAQASADVVNDRMRKMFGGEYNTTRPGVVEGSTRGVVTGGGVSVRQPIKTMSGWSFDPPSISAGCGGIDLYGGNLSFPDKEQYIQMGRAIIGNIGGAAFKMALEQTCELCASVMANIQDTVNALNFDNMSSCQIAQQMVTATKDGENPFGWAAEAGRNVAATWKRDSGQSRDIGSANDAGPGKAGPTPAAMNDPEMRELLQGNFVWQGLERTGAADWLTSSRAGREEVMSLIGTVIMCSSAGGKECPTETASADPGAHPFMPLLTLAEYATLSPGANETYKVYSCASDEDECLNPKIVERKFEKTAAQMIVEAYLGDGETIGALQRSVLPGNHPDQQPLSALEAKIIGQTQGIAAKVFACARQGAVGMGHADFIVRSMAPQVAADFLHTTLVQTIGGLQEYVTRNGQKVGAGEAAELLRNARQQMDRDMQAIREKTAQSDALAIALDRCTPHAMPSFSMVGG